MRTQGSRSSPQTDNVHNLGIKTFLNGTLTSNIIIDTTAVATDTIQYLATDQTGLTATSTRTVIVQLPPATPAPASDAPTTTPPPKTSTSTEATSTAQ